MRIVLKSSVFTKRFLTSLTSQRHRFELVRISALVRVQLQGTALVGASSAAAFVERDLCIKSKGPTGKRRISIKKGGQVALGIGTVVRTGQAVLLPPAVGGAKSSEH